MIKLPEAFLKAEQGNPFNYTGSKHRYLKELFEVLPGVEGKNLNVLDPFVGGGDLISKLPRPWCVTASDSLTPLIRMHQDMQRGIITTSSVIEFIEHFGLSKTNESGYLSTRSLYNNSGIGPSHDNIALYSLACHSNSNRIRFAQKTGDFNMPFGKRTFNSQMQKKLDNHCDWIKSAIVKFYNKSFEAWNFRDFDLLLIDSPYPNSVACYNERNGWTFKQELKLYTKIDDADDHGVKFVYFGQTWANGNHNPTLEKWAQQYNVKELKNTSHQCSANRKNGKTIEIMVYNK